MARAQIDKNVAIIERELKKGNIFLPSGNTLNPTVPILFDVSASNVFTTSHCSKECYTCGGTMPVQVCSFSFISKHKKILPAIKFLDTSNIISGAWGSQTFESLKEMGFINFDSLCDTYSKIPYTQHKFGTYLYYLKSMIMSPYFKNLLNVHLVIYTDGDIASNEKQAFLTLVNTIILSNVIKITLIFPRYTNPNDITTITRSWSNILGGNKQSIIFDHIIQNTGPELYSIIATMTTEQISVTPLGYKSMFGLFMYNDNATLPEIITFLRQHPEIAEKLEEIILNIMKVNPSLFVGDDANLYAFTHRILICYQQKKEYLDKVSVIKGQWEKMSKTSETVETKLQCEAFKKLLDSTRDNAETAEKIAESLKESVIGIMLPKLTGEVTKEAILLALKDGSGVSLISIIKGLFTSGAPPLYIPNADGSVETRGMLVLEPISSTPRDCLKAISTLFSCVSPGIIIPISQILVILMSILSTDVQLPVKVLDMFFKIFQDVTIIKDIFGISDDGKTITLPDNHFSQPVAKVFLDALFNYGDIILKDVGEHMKVQILNHISVINTIYQQFNALYSIIEKFPSKSVPINFTVGSDGFQKIPGAIVLIKPFPGEPWINVPLCGIILEVYGNTARVLELDQKGLVHGTSIAYAVDTHTIELKNLTAISSSFITGYSHSQSLYFAPNVDKSHSKESILPEDVNLILSVLEHEAPSHPLLQVHNYLCSLIEEGERVDGSHFSYDAKRIPEVRKSCEDKINNLCSDKCNTETINDTLPLSQLINYLVAKLGLSTDISSLLRQGQKRLDKATIMKVIEGKLSKEIIPTLSVTYKGLKKPLIPDDELVFLPYYKQLKDNLSKIRVICHPSPLLKSYCPVCMDDDIDIKELVMTTCHHLICKDCKKGSEQVLLDARNFTVTQTETLSPEKAIELSCCKCFCGQLQPMPTIPLLDKLLNKGEGIEPHDVFRFCSTHGCGNPYKGQVSCDGSTANMSMYCTPCNETMLRKMDSTRKRTQVECPNRECGIMIGRSGGCDFMRCSNTKCATEFCYGCSFIFPKGTVYDWNCTCVEPGTYGDTREYNPASESTCSAKYSSRY